jgi:membrane protease YdiL (CAAX protease family)
MSEPIENEAGFFQTRQTKYSPAVFAFMSLAILFVLYQLIGGGITLLIIGSAITQDNVTAARLATMFSQIIFLLIPTIYLAHRQHGRLTEVFRWRIPSFAEAILAIAGMIVLMQLSETYLYFQNKIPLPESLLPIIDAWKKAIEEAFKLLIVSRSVPEMLFVVVVAALTPSICEELMFRGLIQKNLSLAYGSKKGYLFAGVIFGLYHLNPFWIVPLMGLGIYFSFLRQRSDTLWLPILAHLINNGAATVGVYLYGATDDMTPTMFLGTEGGPSDATVLGTGIFFAVIFFLIIVQYIKITDSVQSGTSDHDFTA